jgi:hypothetical protein
VTVDGDVGASRSTHQLVRHPDHRRNCNTHTHTNATGSVHCLLAANIYTLDNSSTDKTNKQTNSVALSPQANYTD